LGHIIVIVVNSVTHCFHCVIETSAASKATVSTATESTAAASKAAATASEPTTAAAESAAATETTIILERSSWSTLHKGPHWSSHFFSLEASALVRVGSELYRFTFLIMVE
jgi:hypothetical protein